MAIWTFWIIPVKWFLKLVGLTVNDFTSLLEIDGGVADNIVCGHLCQILILDKVSKWNYFDTVNFIIWLNIAINQSF